MWHQLLLLTCCLIPWTIGKSSSISYLLLIPAEIHFPSNEKLCVDVQGAQETLKVTATLQHGTEDSILLQEMMTEHQLFTCVQFKTPPPEGGKEEVVTVFISLVGPTTQISNSKKVLVRAVGHPTLIQTDKPLYKRGQTVNFRILIFNRDFLAVDDVCPMVEIQDPNKNRIGQWLNLKPQKGIIDLFYSLNSEAPLGAYTIIAPHAREDFHVAEYVIPTFEVTVHLPSVVTLLEKTFLLKTCGRYTFGKPVQGEITVTVCREAICYYWMRSSCPKDICTEYKGQTEKNGCIEVEVSTEPYDLRSYDYQLTFDAKATLVENGTGIEMTGTGSCRISAKIATVTFDDKELLDSYYKISLRYKTKMILESADGSPMKSQMLYLTEKYGKTIKEHEYETNEHGEAYITLDTKPWNGNPVHLTATYKKEKPERTYGELNPYYVDAYRNLQPFTTITNSFLKVQALDFPLTCGKVHEIEIDYIIRSSEVLSEEDSLEFHYVVVAKGSLVLNGKMNVKMENTSVMMGTIILPLNVTMEISPLAKIFAYAILSDRRIAADTEKFPVGKCFNNKVTLDFSKKEALPGSDVTLRLSADPGSLCSVRSVDKGVLLLRPEADISEDTVYRFIARRHQFGYPYRVNEDDPICWRQRVSFLHSKRRKRSYNWQAPSSPDVFTLIKHIGLKVITNTHVKKPPECFALPPVSALNTYDYGSPNIDIDVSEIPSSIDEYDDSYPRVTLTMAEITNKIRTMFPETWIYQLLTTGSTGLEEILMQLPDSITEWKTTAFCMGDVGLGIAPTASIQSFQPYFIDFTHPYSVVKGEKFSLTATVFNYLASPIMVKFHIEESEDLQMYDCPKCGIPQCLPPQQTIVFAWEAKALHIGFAEIHLRTEAISTQELCNGQRPIVPDTGSSDSLVKTVLVKERPKLWDQRDANYANRARKEASWRQICRQMFHDFGDWPHEEQQKLMEDVMKRWRNIRDQYRRERQQWSRSGDAGYVKRKYVYYDCLSFLAPILDLRPFLSTGPSYAALHYEFLIGKSTISGIVRSTCAQIWTRLHQVVMPEPRMEDWLRISRDFEEDCQFPNCIGALDGKHIRVRKPPNSGSQFFNYKQYFSVVLLALVDPQYKFLIVDIGAYGRTGDSRVFNTSIMARRLRTNQLDLPPPRQLPGSPEQSVPYVLVADEAFQLSRNVMRPYPRCNLDHRRKNF
ncbi:alpha-2-macroglobulin-like protein 1 isoform X2 [Dendrobates tinctorius]|uniref:alpha-2-macroglobulin-like protein 1 isoform X2 n=1 Tax=Dendrobates tinctorius TaxID=92724 RepID=UPI003CCA111C